MDGAAAPSLRDFRAAWELFRDPVLAGVIAGGTLGCLGVYVVLRRMVFVSAALSQAAGLGVALAFYAQVVLGAGSILGDPLATAMAFTIATMLLLMRCGSERWMSRESLLGAVYLVGGAGALLVGTRIRQEAHDIQTILFGAAVLVTPADLTKLELVGAATIALQVVAGRGFRLASFDPDGARIRGLPVRLLDTTLFVSIAVSVSVATRSLGALPVFAFSVLPAMAAILVAPNVRAAMVLAAAFGAIAGGAGYVMAFLHTWPVGASQTAFAAGLVVVARVVRGAMGRWAMGRSAVFAGVVVGVLAAALPAAAQPAPPPPLSPAELAEIQRASFADKAAAPPQPPPSVPVPAPLARALSSLNPSISFIADLALAAWSGAHLETGGHDPRDNGFNLQGLEMAVSADVDPYFKFNANIVFGHEGVELEEAYATTTALPGNLQLRAGGFLTRFGRINPTHPHAWDFVDQPLVIGKMLGPDGNRGLGAEVSWLAPLPWYTEIVLSETMAGGACCARSFYGEKDLGVKSPRDLETMIALKQFHALSPDWSLALGLSAALGPNPTYRGAESYLLGADLYLKYRPITQQSATIVSLQAEAITRRRDTPAGALADTGLYAQLVWRFAQRWTAGARYDFVSGARDDYLDPAWESARHRATTNVTFFPTEFSRLRLQGSADVPTWQRVPTYAAFLALEVAVGPHGSHAF